MKKNSFVIAGLVLSLSTVLAITAPNKALSQTAARPAVNEIIYEPIESATPQPKETISIDPRMPARKTMSIKLSPGVGNAISIDTKPTTSSAAASQKSGAKAAMTTFPPDPRKDFYLDCPTNTTNTYCASAPTPSEKGLSPMTETNARNPKTGRNACLLRGCIIEERSKDVGCYTYAVCEPNKS